MIKEFFLQHTYLIGLVSFLFGLISMPIVVRIAKAKGFVVRPNKRMCHEGSIPNIGGLDIYFSVMLSYLLFDFSQIGHNQFFLIGVGAIMAIGYIDDVLVLTPFTKLLGEALAGTVLNYLPMRPALSVFMGLVAAAAIVFIYGGRRHIRPIYNTQA